MDNDYDSASDECVMDNGDDDDLQMMDVCWA